MGQLHDSTPIALTEKTQAQLATADPQERLAEAVLALQRCREHVINGTRLAEGLNEVLGHVQIVRQLLYPPERMIMPTVAVYREFTRVEPVPGSLAEAALGCMRPPVESTLVVPALFGDRDPYANTHGPIIGLPNEGCQGTVGNSCDAGGCSGEPTQAQRVDELIADAYTLREAIKKHHADRGNDRCWENDKSLYVAAGLEPGDPGLPPLDEHCRMCSRYRRGLYEGKNQPEQWIAIRLLGGVAKYDAVPGFGDEQPKSEEVHDPHLRPAFVLSMHGIKTKTAPMMVPAVYDCDWVFLCDSDQDRHDAVTWLQQHKGNLDFTPTMTAEIDRFINALGRGDKLLLYDDYWRIDRIVS